MWLDPDIDESIEFRRRDEESENDFIRRITEEIKEEQKSEELEKKKAAELAEIEKKKAAELAEIEKKVKAQREIKVKEKVSKAKEKLSVRLIVHSTTTNNERRYLYPNDYRECTMKFKENLIKVFDSRIKLTQSEINQIKNESFTKYESDKRDYQVDYAKINKYLKLLKKKCENYLNEERESSLRGRFYSNFNENGIIEANKERVHKFYNCVYEYLGNYNNGMLNPKAINKFNMIEEKFIEEYGDDKVRLCLQVPKRMEGDVAYTNYIHEFAEFYRIGVPVIKYDKEDLYIKDLAFERNKGLSIIENINNVRELNDFLSIDNRIDYRFVVIDFDEYVGEIVSEHENYNNEKDVYFYSLKDAKYLSSKKTINKEAMKIVGEINDSIEKKARVELDNEEKQNNGLGSNNNVISSNEESINDVNLSYSESNNAVEREDDNVSISDFPSGEEDNVEINFEDVRREVPQRMNLSYSGESEKNDNNEDLGLENFDFSEVGDNEDFIHKDNSDGDNNEYNISLGS